MDYINNVVCYDGDRSFDIYNDKTFNHITDDFIYEDFLFNKNVDGHNDIHVKCNCGSHTFSDKMFDSQIQKVYRIYIPRIMNRHFGFASEYHVRYFINMYLSSFCNIWHIDIRWLPDVCDFSVFVYLDDTNPIILNPEGKKAFCNLTCDNCHAHNIHILNNSFWKLLPYKKNNK
jgi:hypothetical protein